MKNFKIQNSHFVMTDTDEHSNSDIFIGKHM